MLTFLRKIRQSLIETGSARKYFLYAIGEIALVVIGILIALQINNWNESRKQENELADILEIIKNDLISDTLTVSNQLNYYKVLNQRIQKVLNNEIPKIYFDTINELNFNFKECIFCRHQAIRYGHVFIKDKGIELLNKHNTAAQDTILSSLLSFHKRFEEWFADDNKIMVEMTRKNLVDLEKYAWYPVLNDRKYNADYLEYIYESTEYRNKLSTYMLHSRRVVKDIEEFKETANNYINILGEMTPGN